MISSVYYQDRMTEKNKSVEVKECSGGTSLGTTRRTCHPNEEEAGCVKCGEDFGERAPHLQTPLAVGGTRLVCSRFKELKEGHCIWGAVRKGEIGRR